MRPHVSTLLLRLVAVAAGAGAFAASACESTPTHESCYTPGPPEAKEGPPLPCLSEGDRRLPALLAPSCTTDFSVESGPTQKTNAGGTVCCYTTQYDGDPCVTGRPLFIDGAPAHAPIVRGAAWV